MTPVVAMVSRVENPGGYRATCSTLVVQDTTPDPNNNTVTYLVTMVMLEPHEANTHFVRQEQMEKGISIVNYI